MEVVPSLMRYPYSKTAEGACHDQEKVYNRKSFVNCDISTRLRWSVKSQPGVTHFATSPQDTIKSAGNP